MSQENVELVQSLYAAWSRGDFSADDWAHPDIEYVIEDGPAPGSWTGLAGMAEAWRSILEAWEGFRSEVDEYLDLDDERVLALFHYTGRGRISGIDLGEMQSKGAHLLHVRNGKVSRSVVYFDQAEALEAVGLRE